MAGIYKLELLGEGSEREVFYFVLGKRGTRRMRNVEQAMIKSVYFQEGFGSRTLKLEEIASAGPTIKSDAYLKSWEKEVSLNKTCKVRITELTLVEAAKEIDDMF